MLPMSNIGLSDLNIFLYGLERAALVAVIVIIATVLLRKKDFIPVKYKNLVMLLVGLWSVAIIFQSCITIYNYVQITRSFQQKYNRQTLGL